MVEMRANLQPRISTAQTPRLGDGRRRGRRRIRARRRLQGEASGMVGDAGRRRIRARHASPLRYAMNNLADGFFDA